MKKFLLSLILCAFALPYAMAQTCEETSTATVTLTQRPLTQEEEQAVCGTTYESEIAFYRVTPGVLPGIFTVAQNATTLEYTYVRFSCGNLQYLPASAEGDSVWRFAPNQYDYIGNGTTNGGTANTYSGGNQHAQKARDHESVAWNDRMVPADSMWYDLFGFGTSGNNGKHPLMTSTNNGDYLNASLTGTNAQYDWGVHNKIFLGGDQAGQWRALTSSEWSYLINTRRSSDGKRLSCTGRIEITTGKYVQGLFIFPDGFMDIENPDSPGNTMETNRALDAILSYTSPKSTFTLTQFAALEKVGVVFLPAAGYRSGTAINSAGSEGRYWSSTGSSSRSDLAYNCYFSSSGSITPSISLNKTNGCSVRLVQDFTK